MPKKTAPLSSDTTPSEERLEMRFVPALGYSILARDAADAEEKARRILHVQSLPSQDAEQNDR